MNDRLDDLIALAALGELDERETAELEAAAAADPVVARSLASALAAAASLQATAREDPPASLRSSVLDAIANTRQEPAASTSWAVAPTDDQEAVASTSSTVAPSDDQEAVASTSSTVAPSDEPEPDTDVSANVASIDQRRRPRLFAPLAVAAAALMLVAGGVIVATRNEPDSGGQVAAVVDAADVQTRTLDGALTGTLEVAYSASEDAMALVGTDLAELSDDETYQLWLVDSDGATSVGTFRPNDDGVVEERFDDVDPSAFVVGVTREPAGGSDQPTLPILAAA